jgi:hypothetical protein
MRTYQRFDGAFRTYGRERLAGPVALAVFDQNALVNLDVAAQLRATHDQTPGLRFGGGFVQHNDALSRLSHPIGRRPQLLGNAGSRPIQHAPASALLLGKVVRLQPEQARGGWGRPALDGDGHDHGHEHDVE